MNKHLDNFDVFPWNENFETGIQQVDDQHKTLVLMLNQLTDALVHDNPVELSRIFDELAVYAKYHFDSEEAIWASKFGDDRWLALHCETHESFLPKVLELKAEQGDKPLRVILEHVVKFLIRWLAFHIIDSDKRMAHVIHYMDAGCDFETAKLRADEEMSGSARVLIDTVLNMYDGLSSRTLELMRERVERKKAEAQLREANRLLEEQAVTDQLTGLFNRRHFDEVFEQELRRAKREQRVLSYIMLDIDHFKKLNDHYGHLQGDIALKKVGEILIEICRRPGDYAFRLGGEEFSVLVADQGEQCGVEFAERIRAAIESSGIPNIQSPVSDKMTTSIGLLSKIPEADCSMDRYLKIADTRLYAAKQQGRNCVVAHD
ncbi:GGDEF domain-containing protein [Magnetococcus sp. PR-3]|uniref:GGDEF domain-containing protein n=1 Tax=Magnetococcus sp. PR-3 TaxID=3120355 RepID=UPI002FCDEB09